MAVFNLSTTPVEIDSGAAQFVAVTNTGSDRIVILRGTREIEQLRPGARGVYYSEDDIALNARTVAGLGSADVAATAKNPSRITIDADGSLVVGSTTVELVTDSDVTSLLANAFSPASPIDPKYLKRWHAATAKARTNTGQAFVACFGDSTTLASNLSGQVYSGPNWPSYLKTLMSTWAPNPVNGFAYPKATYNSGSMNDDRIALSGTTVSGSQGWIANSWGMGSVGNTITFTPGFETDRLEVIYLGFPNYGSAEVSIDGGTTALATIVGNTTAGVHKATVTATKGSNVYTIKRVAAGPGGVYITMIRAWDSTVGSIQFANLGAPGKTTADFDRLVGVNNWDSRHHAGVLVPDLLIISTGINDSSSKDVTAFLADMQGVIDTWKPYSDILITTWAPSAITGRLVNQIEYAAALPAFCAANGVAFANTPFHRWGADLNTGTNLGLMGDTLHPNAAGQMDIAQALNALLRVS